MYFFKNSKKNQENFTKNGKKKCLKAESLII